MADELSVSVQVSFNLENVEFVKMMAKAFDKASGDFDAKTVDLTTSETQLDPDPLSGDAIYLIINTGANNVNVGYSDGSYRWFALLLPGEFCFYPSNGDVPPYVKTTSSTSTVEYYAFIK